MVEARIMSQQAVRYTSPASDVNSDYAMLKEVSVEEYVDRI
jgi:hypothetical protein